MGVTVTPDDGAPVEEQPTVASPLRTLKDRRKNLLSSLQLTLQVPRWDDPEIFVVYKPVETSLVAKSTAKRSEDKDPDWLVLANADLLAQCCVGIYAIFDKDGVKRSLDMENEFGEWTRFDSRLAANLGLDMPPNKVVDVVRAIYPTDGDLIAAAEEVSNWSSRESTRVDEDFTKP